MRHMSDGWMQDGWMDARWMQGMEDGCKGWKMEMNDLKLLES